MDIRRDPSPTARIPEEMQAEFWCSTCGRDTYQAVLTDVSTRDFFAAGGEQILSNHLTICCAGCKTVSFCHSTRNTADEVYDDRGLPGLIRQDICYPLPAPDASEAFVALSRIEELRALPRGRFDTSKLVRLLVELNATYGADLVYASAMLLRAIVDHVPPVFGQDSFAAVANNYGGPRSFREAAQHLDGAMRSIADGCLHLHIRAKEELPTKVRVEFRADLDLLLGELIRVLSMSAP